MSGRDVFHFKSSFFKTSMIESTRTLIRILVLTAAVLSIAACAAAPQRAQSTPNAHLAPLNPWLGKTWKALVDVEKNVYDIARWELVLDGQAVRILHSVADGAYGGETLVVWDQQRESLVYYYFTTAGFYTHGTMRVDDAGRLISEERASGDAGGVTDIVATQEVIFDTQLRVHTKMLRNGQWEDRGEVIYTVDDSAEVILP